MAYLDGQLGAERAAAVHSHVSTCIVCQRLRSEIVQVSGDMALWEVGEPPASLKAPPIRERGRTSRLRLGWVMSSRAMQVSAVAAAGVLIVATVSVLPLRTSPSYMTASRLDPQAISGSPPPPTSMPMLMGGPHAVVGGPPERAPVRAVGSAQAVSGPRVVRTARLRMLASDFDAARRSVDAVVTSMGGFLGQVNVSGAQPDIRHLTATLRVPSEKLDATLTALKAAGEVLEEAQSADDVTEQLVDLEARIANGRNTEKRLNELLQRRAGTLADVLAGEREIARVREEIERLDAQRTNLDRRVTYATVTLQIDEERKASLNLGRTTTSARIRNAAVDGFRGAFESVFEAVLLVARVAPFLILWGLVLAWPVTALVRRRRRAKGSKEIDSPA
jgi:hypothetical protein